MHSESKPTATPNSGTVKPLSIAYALFGLGGLILGLQESGLRSLFGWLFLIGACLLLIANSIGALSSETELTRKRVAAYIGMFIFLLAGVGMIGVSLGILDAR